MHRHVNTIQAVMVFLFLCLGPVSAIAQNSAGYAADQVIIKFKSTAARSDIAQVETALQARVVTTLDLIRGQVWEIKGLDVEQAVARFSSNPAIEYVEPNYILQAVATYPNDPHFSSLWGMHNTGPSGCVNDVDIDGPEAWDLHTGTDVLVGVIDTGVDYNHPDLAANIWTNSGETAGNGIDDDGNGYIDDIHGWDFANNDNNPMDDNGHGTHCSGTIAGVGNNGVGVAGVCWQARIMGLKFLSSSGSGLTSNAILCVQYAVRMNARLTSNSWGCMGSSCFSQAMFDAIQAARSAGQLFVAAAGNSNTNTDITPNYPSCYALDNIISVAAIDCQNLRANYASWGSNYGLTTVDLAAPGVNVLSTTPNNTYSSYNGTSMACPHVAGAAALIWSYNPSLTWQQVKSNIMTYVDDVPNMEGQSVTGGRLNIYQALLNSGNDAVPPAMISDLQVLQTGSSWADLRWTATGDDGGAGRATFYDIRYATFQINESNFNTASVVPDPPSPLLAGSVENFRVPGLAASTTYYFAVKALDERRNASPASNSPSGRTLGIPDISVRPTSLAQTLNEESSATQQLLIANEGQGTLDFRFSDFTAVNLLAMPGILKNPSSADIPYLLVPKGQADPRLGHPVVLGAGGPDAFGYRWIDSDQAGGPLFNWRDISTSGTLLTGLSDDNYVGPIPIGFSFPFYENSYSQIMVQSNGVLNFAPEYVSLSNQTIPTVAAPNNLIAWFWDDLACLSTSRVYYQTVDDCFVIQFMNYGQYLSGGTINAQVLLFPNGKIVYQYLNYSSISITSSTIGIENAAGSTGLQVAFNTSYIHPSLAVELSNVPDFLSVTPTQGNVPAGSSMNVNVTFSSAGINPGSYENMLQITSNDPDEPAINIPARLYILASPPLLAIDPRSADATLSIGQTATQIITMKNAGGKTLDWNLNIIETNTISSGWEKAKYPPAGSVPVLKASTEPYALDRSGTGEEPPPPTAAAAGDILTSWVAPSPITLAWGVGHNGTDVFLTCPSLTPAMIYRTSTAGVLLSQINCSGWAGSWVGDLACGGNYIYAVNVGGDNNIKKIDMNSGNLVATISGAWNTTSARGLAYDAARDEFYIGGWNHSVIYRINATGATLSTIPFTAVSGLAWHRGGRGGLGSLWVSTNAATDMIYEIDPGSGAVLQSFRAPGTGDGYWGGGLEVDDTGKLWMVCQDNNTVYKVDSGVMTTRWLSAAPASGHILPGAIANLAVTFNTGFLTGNAHILMDYYGHIDIASNDPHTPILIPAHMHINDATSTRLLTMQVNPGNSGVTVPTVGTHTFDVNSIVAVSAAAKAGHRFLNWTGNVADPNSANTTVTMSANQTVQANFTAEQISTLCASVQSDAILLEWSTLVGTSIYNVYRGTTYNFVPDVGGGTNRIGNAVGDQDPARPGVQWSDRNCGGADVVGDISTNYFYRVAGLYPDEGPPSNVAGEFDYPLITTSGTDINEIVVLFDTRTTLVPITTAEELVRAVPNANVVYAWDVARQGFNGHQIGLPFNNFGVSFGQPFRVNVTAPGVWTTAGAYSSYYFDLRTTVGTDLNFISLPPVKNLITNAELLCQDIPVCNVAYNWIAASQGRIGHQKGLPFNNFATAIGYPYMINVTDNYRWPAVGLAKVGTEESTTGYEASVELLAAHIPHLVYGEISLQPANKAQHESLQLKAWIVGREQEVMTEATVGCGTDGHYWWINVGNLPSSWQAGEWVHVEVVDNINNLRGVDLVVLTNEGSDNGDLLALRPAVSGQEQGLLPNEPTLYPNFPNPFNPRTEIRYALPREGQVSLMIFDIQGRLVKRLFTGVQSFGFHRLVWEGDTDSGIKASSGIYLCRLQSREQQCTIKLIYSK